MEHGTRAWAFRGFPESAKIMVFGLDEKTTAREQPLTAAHSQPLTAGHRHMRPMPAKTLKENGSA